MTMFPRKNASRETGEDSGSILLIYAKHDQVDSTTIAKNFSYQSEMSLQFNVEEFIRPLVSTMYESSDEHLEIDTQSVTEIDQSHDDDSDIEVKSCYREKPPSIGSGRAMTLVLSACREEQVQSL